MEHWLLLMSLAMCMAGFVFMTHAWSARRTSKELANRSQRILNEAERRLRIQRATEEMSKAGVTFVDKQDR